ncbi:thioesterase family protein [Aliikangiella sp. G2MR2-5]|uniref:acyl-CoA thioesterase n=1 Tax=Aliikangiella sp. G2MR2-5 TaxID=2788943 RepID=UPI0018A91927|nr:thioesterase family protein [Aliikangiella sp. G2MR2-5]
MTNQQNNTNQFSFSIEQDLIWGDMDAFNHINNTKYFRYFENVRIEYFQKVGINQFMAKEKVGPILGETSCRYLSPLTYPDRITIRTGVTILREKRFTMNYEILSKKQNKVVATGSGEVIFLDYKTGITCPIPLEITKQIKALEKQAGKVL